MLTYIPIAEISAVWPTVRPLILRANSKLGERNTPEEIYHALRLNQAGLYLFGEPRGCVVAQKLIELDGSVTCFIWLYVGALEERQHEMKATIEQLGRSLGAQRLRFRSPRKGWERASDGYWQVREIMYEHILGADHAENTPRHYPVAA